MRRMILPALMLFVFGTGCVTDTAKKDKQQGTNFLFYPLPNIYFDQDNKEYYFFDSTQSNWQTTADLPAPIVARLGRSVRLDSVPVPVYRDNEMHKLIHGAILYSSPDKLRQQYHEDSMASLPKPDTLATPATDSVQAKKKSRVGRWLQKIFGKKDEN